jgi:uncharacterized damage-inducible protein DinB
MQQEVWLSGPVEGVSPILMPVAHALLQAVADIEKVIEDLTVEELWTKPNGAPSVGFHLLHIAGSVDRLLTYSLGESLTENQFAELAGETKAADSASAQMLAANTIKRIQSALDALRSTPDEILLDKREVGREKLPSNVFGLLFHIAEHTQRHVGQAITTATIVRKNISDKK